MSEKYTVLRKTLEEVSTAVIENGNGVLNLYAKMASAEEAKKVDGIRGMVNATRVKHLAVVMHQAPEIETDGSAIATLAQLKVLADKCGVSMKLSHLLANELDDIPKALPPDFFTQQVEANVSARREPQKPAASDGFGF